MMSGHYIAFFKERLYCKLNQIGNNGSFQMLDRAILE